MKHFLDIEQLSQDEMIALFEKATFFKQNQDKPQETNLSTVALMFYENSTRTRISFEKAAQQLSMPVIQVDITRSSESKGEMITDTISNLAAMGITHYVIRHSEDGLPIQLAKALSSYPIHIINAGEGQRAHPSQAMLDMMTILAYYPNLSEIKIALVGNLRHSRVARSLIQACKILGVGALNLVSPEIWKPQSLGFGHWTNELSQGLQGADVVMGLRVQKERIAAEESFDFAQYQQAYRIDSERMKLANPNAIVMHPGPVNRDIEMTSDVIDGPQSKILEQVSNGVFMRMAILDMLST